MNKISFNTIRSLFDDSWDVGVISAETLKRVSLTPIKAKFHINGYDFTNNIHFGGLTNTIVLIKDGSTWDYSFYDEANSILKSSTIKNWYPIYTNYKEAAIFAGLGVRARNSLVYSYKFGFDCHIYTVGITDQIIDLPTNKRINYKLWSRCKNCLDCVNACPANAIHGKEEPYWLDSSACDNFIAYSSHKTIPSIKTFWSKFVHPEVEQSVIDDINSFEDVRRHYGPSLPFDNNGYTYDGNMTKKDGEPVVVPVCRECTSQPRCSKWGGKYPYDEFVKEQPIKFYK